MDIDAGWKDKVLLLLLLLLQILATKVALLGTIHMATACIEFTEQHMLFACSAPFFSFYFQ
jgi:hypothetical protein